MEKKKENLAEKAFLEWLEEDCNQGGKIHERICFLVYANGGFDVGSWGCLSGGGLGDSHQRGLDQNDAINLIGINGFFNGAGLYDFDPHIVFFENYLEAYCDKVKEVNKDEP